MLEADGFHDIQRFSSIYDSIHWGTVPLLQSHRVGLKTMLYPDRVSANGNFIWFDSFNATTVSYEAAHQGRNRLPQ